LQVYFIFARFCEFQKLFEEKKANELLKEGNKGSDQWRNSYELYPVRAGGTQAIGLPGGTLN
jgi:hypothetical protein